MRYFELASKAKSIMPPSVFSALSLVKNIPFNFISFYLEKRYDFLGKNFPTYGISRKNRKIKVILNITTFPARITKVYLPIETILRQTIKPDKIILWLAIDEFPLGIKSLPKKLLEMKKRGLEIRLIKNNLRSNNKIFHGLKEFPNFINVNFDDDCFYPKDYLEILLKAHNKYPSDIIGYDSHQIKLDNQNQVMPYKSWFYYDKKKVVGNDIFLLSANGIIYPPNSMPKEAFDENVLKEISWYNDDIWFKAMALIKGVKHRRISGKNKKFPIVLGTQKFGLFHSNVIGNRNNKIIKDVFGKYNLAKKINAN